MQNAGGGSGYEDAINTHDGKQYIDNLPERIYYHSYKIEEANNNALRGFTAQFYGYQISGTTVLKTYPNQSLKSLRIYNAYARAQREPTKSLITIGGFTAPAWEKADFYQWGDTNNGIPKDQCLYSFYGFIRGDINGNVWLVRNGILESLPSNVAAIENLPVVRYILPYPQEAIQRSSGVYKNYYGYK